MKAMATPIGPQNRRAKPLLGKRAPMALSGHGGADDRLADLRLLTMKPVYRDYPFAGSEAASLPNLRPRGKPVRTF